MKAVLFVLCLPMTALAVPLNSSWHFQRTDGVMGTVSLTGDLPNCIVYPAGKDTNISIQVGSITLQSASCFDGPVAPIVRGTFALPDGSLQDGEVSYGKSFAELMTSYTKFGPDAVGPIGNSSTFPCSSDAVAFISIPGFVVGDPREDLIGYCLIP